MSKQTLIDLLLPVKYNLFCKAQLHNPWRNSAITGIVLNHQKRIACVEGAGGEGWKVLSPISPAPLSACYPGYRKSAFA